MFDVDALFKAVKFPWARVLGIFAIALATFGILRWSDGHRTAKTIAKAEVHDVAAVSDLGEAKAQAQIAQDRLPELQAARDQVASLKAQLAEALKSREPGQKAPAAPDAVVIQDQGRVIQAQDRKADLLEAQLSTVAAENKANHAAALEFQAEAKTLQKAAAPAPTRALGVLWNPADQTYGVCFDQDVWRLRLGVDVMQQRLPVQAGGSVKVAAALRVQFRF